MWKLSIDFNKVKPNVVLMHLKFLYTIFIYSLFLMKNYRIFANKRLIFLIYTAVNDLHKYEYKI